MNEKSNNHNLLRLFAVVACAKHEQNSTRIVYILPQDVQIKPVFSLNL